MELIFDINMANSSCQPFQIYQYSEAMFKHILEKLLKQIQKRMLYINKPVAYNRTTTDGRTYNSNAVVDLTNNNIDNRTDKFQIQIKNKFVYRIPLWYFSDIGKINFPLKIYKISPQNTNEKAFWVKKNKLQLMHQTLK